MLLRKLLSTNTKKPSNFNKSTHFDDMALVGDQPCLKQTEDFTNPEEKIHINRSHSIGQDDYHRSQSETTITIKNNEKEASRMIINTYHKSTKIFSADDKNNHGKVLSGSPMEKCQQINRFFKSNQFVANLFCNIVKGKNIDEVLKDKGHSVTEKKPTRSSL